VRCCVQDGPEWAPSWPPYSWKPKPTNVRKRRPFTDTRARDNAGGTHDHPNAVFLTGALTRTLYDNVYNTLFNSRDRAPGIIDRATTIIIERSAGNINRNTVCTWLQRYFRKSPADMYTCKGISFRVLGFSGFPIGLVSCITDRGCVVATWTTMTTLWFSNRYSQTTTFPGVSETPPPTTFALESLRNCRVDTTRFCFFRVFHVSSRYSHDSSTAISQECVVHVESRRFDCSKMERKHIG